MTNNGAKFETIKAFLPPLHQHVISIKRHNIESRFVIGPSNIPFGGVCVCIFQPVNFTGCGNEGVNCEILGTVPWFVRLV